MITNDAQRTRVLYNWELNDLLKRNGVKQLSWKQADKLAMVLCGFVAPIVEIRDVKYVPFYDGLKIILTQKDRYNLTLVHELAHFLTFHAKGHHPKVFVVEYIKLLHEYFGWDLEELLMQAHWRGLI